MCTNLRATYLETVPVTVKSPDTADRDGKFTTDEPIPSRLIPLVVDRIGNDTVVSEGALTICILAMEVRSGASMEVSNVAFSSYFVAMPSLMDVTLGR